MKSKFSKRESLLRGISATVLLVAGFCWWRFAPLSSRIVGSWPESDKQQTTVTTFKPNGEWESVTTWLNPKMQCADGSGFGAPSVFKGRYSTWGRTFRTFDMQRYVRRGDTDDIWVPSSNCEAENSCIRDAEITQLDQEVSNPKYFNTIISADWWTGKIKVRASPSGNIKIWTR